MTCQDGDGPAPHLLHSTSENSPEASNQQSSKIAQCLAAATSITAATQPTVSALIPRVVIRHRIKGAKKAQRRLRKNEEQNKILLAEFEKHQFWPKTKIVELQERLGLK